MEKAYEVEVTSHDAQAANALFRVEPPVEFFNDEARIEFCKNVIGVIKRLYGFDGLEDARLNLTHNTADGEATIGYASFDKLRDTTGKEVLRSAISLALNGK